MLLNVSMNSVLIGRFSVLFIMSTWMGEGGWVRGCSNELL